jgi:hypothetical protein
MNTEKRVVVFNGEEYLEEGKFEAIVIVPHQGCPYLQFCLVWRDEVGYIIYDGHRDWEREHWGDELDNWWYLTSWQSLRHPAPRFAEEQEGWRFEEWR